MDARLLTRLLACGRIGIGLALFAAPRTAARLWLGQEGSAATGVLARGLGARDLAIGIGTLVALDGDDHHVDPWLDAAIAADTADAAAVVLARHELDTRVVVGTMAVALGAAAGGLALKQALVDEPAG